MEKTAFGTSSERPRGVAAPPCTTGVCAARRWPSVSLARSRRRRRVVRLTQGARSSWTDEPGQDRAGVERVDDVGVVLLDDGALDLHRRCELAGLHREVVVEDLPLLDRLPPVQA